MVRRILATAVFVDATHREPPAVLPATPGAYILVVDPSGAATGAGHAGAAARPPLPFRAGMRAR